MWIVAVGRWSTSDQREAAALAVDLGITAYEARMKLSAPVPSLIMTTADDARARAIHAALVGRKHEAIAFADTEVVSAAQMISLRRFSFDSAGLSSNDSQQARLPWADISLLLRANHRSAQESTVIQKEKKFDAVRAIASGGLVLSKTTEKTITTRHQEAEQVLYLFRRSGQTPWILRERETHYGALGKVEPASLANFLATITLIRSRAVSATYDESLFSRRGSPEEFDLLAHARSLLSHSPGDP